MQMVSLPALIAGLPDWSATVCVGPSLLASPAGSSSGFLLQNEVPVGFAQLSPVKPHVVPSSMLLPPEIVTPSGPQLPPEVVLARMLLVTVVVPRLELLMLKMAPRRPPRALLPEKVPLITVSVPALLKMAPPPRVAPVAALLPEKVLLATVAPRRLLVKMAPPPLALALLALLPEKVLLVTVRM